MPERDQTRSAACKREADAFAYIRRYYGVPAAVGDRIRYRGNAGTIIGADGHYLRVDLGGNQEPVLIHPTWEVEYATD